MKKFLLTLGLAALSAMPINQAHAYSSAAGPDPKNATGNSGQEIETKLIVKSATASASQALDKGVFVMYDTTAKDGYTVTRAITQSGGWDASTGLKMVACATLVSVASGDTQYHPCITKGFANVAYDGTGAGTGLVAGVPACLRSDGVLRGCNLASNAEATADLNVVPLRTATDSGSALPVIINLQ